MIFMHKMIYMASTLLLISCGEKNKMKDIPSKTHNESTINIDSNRISDSAIVNKKTKEDTTIVALNLFKEFAMNYSPIRKPNLGVPDLPKISKELEITIDIVKTSHPEEFEKYITLIFIKLYSAHLECCHQSYEVRQNIRKLDKKQDLLVYYLFIAPT